MIFTHDLPVPVDGNGTELKEGDNVYTFDCKDYDHTYGIINGILKISDVQSTFNMWYVEWEDGEEFLVGCFDNIYKV